MEFKTTPTTCGERRAAHPTMESYSGRLTSMQQGVCRFLRALPAEHPIIVDVGIGGGAPTICDLAEELRKSGTSAATIVAIDVNPDLVKWSNLILSKMRTKGQIPSGIRIELRHGDILADSESPLSVRSVVESVFGSGARAHLSLSSNLVNGFGAIESKRALASLYASINPNGLVVLSAGDSETYLDVKVFNLDALTPLGTYRLSRGGSHESFAVDLARFAANTCTTDGSPLRSLVLPCGTTSW